MERLRVITPGLDKSEFLMIGRVMSEHLYLSACALSADCVEYVRCRILVNIHESSLLCSRFKQASLRTENMRLVGRLIEVLRLPKRVMCARHVAVIRLTLLIVSGASFPHFLRPYATSLFLAGSQSRHEDCIR